MNAAGEKFEVRRVKFETGDNEGNEEGINAELLCSSDLASKAFWIALAGQ